MKRRSVLHALAAGLAGVLPTLAPAGEAPVRRLRFIWELFNPGSEWLRNEEFACALPASLPGEQQLVSAEASQPLRWSPDCLGQNTALITLAEVAPRQRVRVQLDTRVALPAPGRTAPDSGCDRWQGHGPFLDFGESAIAERAAELRRGSGLDTARAIFDWLVAHVQYTAYSPNDKGALHALNTRQGDCTEFAHLATSLARSAGMAARSVGGYVLTHDAIVKPGDYHDWAELWVDGRWLILDAQRREFDADAQAYLRFRYYSAHGDGTLGSHHRWRTLGQLQVAWQ
ncbi:transglutaminase-like domain-containing protein [Pelomonas sp. BJYL3]|uniref:transglutaminase-like domain-containing protein n=1 Tax=Pelomonas sp. BJYL3 TaxID=2976697 RepID=UPI0022B5DB8E|nr:transglutaminase-like domain-containing protein [Pelomonas sp. BJYL3]